MDSNWNFGRGGRHGHGGPFGGGRDGLFGGRFGGFMGAGGGGRGFRAARMLASGDLQLIVLVLLQEKPRHGYEIIKELEERSSGIYTPSPGVVYPALTYLEEMGFAASEAEGNKKRYSITDAGLEHLGKNRQLADDTLDQLARFGRKLARFQKEFTDEENIQDDFGQEGSGGDRSRARRQHREFKMKFHALWHDIKDAIRDRRDSPVEEKERVYNALKNALDEIRNKK